MPADDDAPVIHRQDAYHSNGSPRKSRSVTTASWPSMVIERDRQSSPNPQNLLPDKHLGTAERRTMLVHSENRRLWNRTQCVRTPKPAGRRHPFIIPHSDSIIFPPIPHPPAPLAFAPFRPGPIKNNFLAVTFHESASSHPHDLPPCAVGLSVLGFLVHRCLACQPIDLHGRSAVQAGLAFGS